MDKFLVGFQVLVHTADEFLYVKVIQSGAIQMEVCKHFDWHVVSETQEFAAEACKPFGVNGLYDLCVCCL